MRKKSGKSSRALQRGKNGKKQSPKRKSSSKRTSRKDSSTTLNVDGPSPYREAVRKFGGVHTRSASNGMCVCGKTMAQCGEDWDRKLGIVSRVPENYKDNLRRIHAAEARGDDPYCWRALIGLRPAVPAV